MKAMTEDQEIPLILHQTWRTSQLPAEFAHWRGDWLRLHPHWEHRFYDDADIMRVVADRAPHLRGVFFALPRSIQRVDLFRYLIVYLDGGLYADIDMIPYRAQDALLTGSSCVIGIEAHIGRRYQRLLGYRRPWQFANCIFAAAPRHPFLGLLIERIAQGVATPVESDDAVEDATGPRLLTRTYFDLSASARATIRVQPQIVWLAPWEYPRIGPLAQRIHARHAAAGSWRTEVAWWRRSWRHRLVARNRWPNPFGAPASTGGERR